MGRAIWIWVGLGALSFLSCTGDSHTDTCGRPEGCSSSQGAGGGGGDGVSCSGGVCSCSKAGDVACCSDGKTDCAVELMACVPEWACPALNVECKEDEDCPGPPDSRCGVPRCNEGSCELEIWTHQPIPNQYPGDCKINMCSGFGEVIVWADPSDIPDDGNWCTGDTCDGDMPANTIHPSKTPCPGGLQGICHEGKCWECNLSLDFYCSTKEYSCYWDTCVPHQCVNNMLDGQETGHNCGGPVCSKCGSPGWCKVDSDCLSGVCEEGECAFPSPTDGVKNGQETGVDCGYPGGPPNQCKDGEGCKLAADCMSAVCYKGVCQISTCFDATKNGAETGADCGGECPPC
jgi:hypothetical protein